MAVRWKDRAEGWGIGWGIAFLILVVAGVLGFMHLLPLEWCLGIAAICAIRL